MRGIEPGHEEAKPLELLIREWPPLRVVMKALQPRYVFVRRYLRTIPKVGEEFRRDAFVNGLYVVDVGAVRRNDTTTIEQDYLVQWLDGRTPEVSYYSGKPKSMRAVYPEIWQRIQTFCDEFGAGGQYRCPNLSHHYSGLGDPDLPQEEPWPRYFALAMKRARALMGGSTSGSRSHPHGGERR